MKSLSLLLLGLLVTTAQAETVALVSICPKEYAQCTPQLANSHYSIPVETKASASCFMGAMMELAKMNLLDSEHDTVLVICSVK